MRPQRGRISDGAAITPVGIPMVYWSTGFYCFTHLPIYLSTSLPINQSTSIRWASPSGAFPCGIGRSVGSSGKPSSRYGYSNSPPSGTPQPAQKYSNDRLGLKPAEGRPDAHRSHYRPAGSARYQKIGLTFSQLLRDAHPPHEDVGLCKGVAFSDKNSESGSYPGGRPPSTTLPAREPERLTVQ